MQRIVVIGASVMDVLMKSSQFKIVKNSTVHGGVALCEVLGGKIEAEEGLMTSGGGGSNVSVGLKRLGEAVKMITKVGEDKMGKIFIDEMNSYQIDLSMVQSGSKNTGVSTVLINGDGQRSIITFRGESLKIDSEKIDWEQIVNADWVQISSLGGRMDLLEDTINFCFEKGIKVGLNPGRAEIESGKLWRLLPKVEALIVNRSEASIICGMVFEKEADIFKKISECGSRVIAITDGKNGAALIRSGKWVKMDTFPNKSVDDTGAGDAFVSGFVEGLINYVSDEKMLKMGLANGSSVVTKMGAKVGLLSKDEMEKWMKKKLKTVEGWIH
jgi:sugar/nucleoside kinase (ribokinase family)